MLSGYTFPTAWDGSTFTFGTQPITGSLTANFGTGYVSGSLGVPMGANTYTTNWADPYPGGPNIFGPYFAGTGSVNATGGDCGCGCSSAIAGFFAGANAARAGLVYEFYGTTYGDIHGAAVFKK
jgi:hypothetical protein